MSIEAMKLALEWIKDATVVLSHTSSAIQGGIGAEAEGVGGCSVAVQSALRQAIEQAQKQEQQHPMMDMPHDQKILHAYGYHKPQRQWVGLTDDEIWKDDAIMSANSGYGATFDTLRDVVRAVEAKLKEKNT